MEIMTIAVNSVTRNSFSHMNCVVICEFIPMSCHLNVTRVTTKLIYLVTYLATKRRTMETMTNAVNSVTRNSLPKQNCFVICESINETQ